MYPPEKKTPIYLRSIGLRVVELPQEGVEPVLPDNLTSLAGDPRLQLTEMMGWKDIADVPHIKGILRTQTKQTNKGEPDFKIIPASVKSWPPVAPSYPVPHVTFDWKSVTLR